MAGFGETNPLAGFAQGYQIGAGIQDRQLALQQQQLAQMQQQQLQADILAVRQSANPTQGIADLALKYPQLSEQFKRSYDMMSQEQQQGQLSHATQVYAALQNGQNDLAVRMMRQRADTMKAAGSAEQAQSANRFADLIEQQPDAAKFTGGLMLAGALGPEKFATTFSTLGQEQRNAAKAPAELAKANADAGIATANAATQGDKNALDLQNMAEDAATKAQQRQIAALDVQIRQANSETQRGELVLQRDKLAAELQQKQEAKTQAAQSQLEGIDRSLETVKSIMQSPAIDGFFTGAGTLGGAQLAMLPGTDRKTLQGLVDTLTSQQFLTSIKDMQGMGALSDAEGARISAAVAKLDLNMKPQAFRNAVGVVQASLEKARNKVIGSGNLPASGGGFVMKTPTYGNVTEGDINRLLRQYPGSTREQVMQFLQQSGAPQAPRVGQ